MVQENTSNTDSDIETPNYPAPRPLNRVGIKVGLGMGLLLSLFAFAGLVSLFQARVVDENVRQITEVEEPTSAAAYEMEINVIGTGMGVLQYLQTGDEIHRWRVAKHEADFDRFKAQYDLLAETTQGRVLGDRLSVLYQEYKALGDTLMDQANRREGLFAAIGGNFQGLDEILDEKIWQNIDLQAPDGHEKYVVSRGMEADIAEVGTWLASFLGTSNEIYRPRVYDGADDFWEELQQFKTLSLTEEEAGWAVELQDLFSQTQALSVEIIDLEDDLDANLAEFVDLRAQLGAVLDDEIQVLTRHDLVEATQIAHDMEARTNTLVFLLLLGGLACGTLVAVAITRGITDPVCKLVAASRAIARGDLSLRANIQSKDEFGILGEAFNEMTEQRQQAHDELEVRVQERTAELSQLNDVMDLADEVARIVTSTLNIDEVYEKFTLEVKKLVDFDRMNINLIDPEAGVFAVKYLAGEDFPGRQIGRSRPLANSRTQYILETGRTLVRSDITGDRQFPEDLADVEAGLLSGIMVPLVNKGQVIGVVGMGIGRVGYYGPREQAILERLASQIAPAMENARLHEERVRFEEQLSHAQRMESVGRLAGGVAHDFNNLLTAIMGYTQLSLGETSNESNVGSHLREIQKATQRATNLTSQLLTFSRHQVVEPKVIDLNDLIIDLDKMLRRLIGEDIELVTLPATDLDPVKVDRGQMEQVLVNLAVNARDAMPVGGKITVETANVIQDADYALQHPGASTGRQVMLSVSDTGSGIPEEVRDHIFEPFFTTKDVGKGTGLGLATCYGIVQQSGGHIEVDSEPGQGTSFKIYLPATEETYEAQSTQVESCILPQGKETVLLAEDEPLVRSMVATVLRDRGYSVLETANGSEALGMVQKHNGDDIQLLLTDVVMPQMSGPELAEQIWVTYPDIKVLFTSGYTGDSISSVNNYPASSNFLPKPYMPEALAVKVREVLDQRAA